MAAVERCTSAPRASGMTSASARSRPSSSRCTPMPRPCPDLEYGANEIASVSSRRERDVLTLFNQKYPSRSGTLPIFFDHRTVGDLSISDPLVEATCGFVIVSNDDAHSLFNTRCNGEFFSMFEQCCPKAFVSPFRIGGEDIHVPGSWGEVLQLL